MQSPLGCISICGSFQCNMLHPLQSDQRTIPGPCAASRSTSTPAPCISRTSFSNGILSPVALVTVSIIARTVFQLLCPYQIDHLFLVLDSERDVHHDGLCVRPFGYEVNSIPTSLVAVIVTIISSPDFKSRLLNTVFTPLSCSLRIQDPPDQH